ncbi:hypothetical protein EAO77_19120 [Streptomyces sp. t39]|nr:hypothetical protein EAO77_19120 [Streptomyces sp. t39]
MKGPAPDVAAGIARLEGYLLAQGRLSEARREAEEFADRMPWLTTAQREDVVSHYVQDRIALTRRVLAALVARAGELRQEYTERYEELRRRLVCGSVAALLCSAALCAAALLAR